MHAFGHQWACQLIYNPRLRPGLGLTDGEGTERLWSRLRKLIPITRGCTVSIASCFMSIVNCFFHSYRAVYGS